MPILLPRESPKLENRSPKQVQNPKSKNESKRIEATTVVRRLRFAPLPVPVVEKPKREKKPRVKVKNDPKHVAAARELRDRYLEQFNSGLVLPAGKYEVSRLLPGAGGLMSAPVRGFGPALPAPMAA